MWKLVFVIGVLLVISRIDGSPLDSEANSDGASHLEMELGMEVDADSPDENLNANPVEISDDNDNDKLEEAYLNTKGNATAEHKQLWNFLPSLFPSSLTSLWSSPNPQPETVVVPLAPAPPPIIFLNLPPPPSAAAAVSTETTTTTTTTTTTPAPETTTTTTTTTTTVAPASRCGCSVTQAGVPDNSTCERPAGAPGAPDTCDNRTLCTVRGRSGTADFTIQLLTFFCTGQPGDFCAITIKTADPNFFGDSRQGTCVGTTGCQINTTTSTIGPVTISINTMLIGICRPT